MRGRDLNSIVDGNLQFLEGSAFISKHPSFERFCRIAFQSCDLQNQGYLSNIEVILNPCLSKPISHMNMKHDYARLT